MSFVKTITTNIKSPDGDSYTVNLGKNTVLIGDNESGKSAIAEAVELSRTGSAFGLLYRDKPVKDGTLLSALIPPSADEATATATLEDGRVCSWTLGRGKRPSREGPNGVGLSVSEIRSILCASEEGKAKYFWAKLCEPKEVETFIRARVPSELQETLALVMPKVDEICLSDLYDRVSKKVRDQSANAKSSRTALASLGSIREVSEDEILGLWDTLERGHARDLLRALYISNQRDPGTHASNTIANLVEQLGGKDAVARIPKTEDVREKLEEAILQKRLLKVAGIARSSEASSEMRGDQLKKLKAHLLSEMQSDLNIKNGPADFRKAVSGFLPRGEKFVFRWNDGRAEIGIERDGAIHTALSGSTEARLLAAIAAALADEDSSLLVVDDRMWDGSTLSKMLTVLEKAPCQVLVMSTIKPKGKRRDSWTYLNIARRDGLALQVVE